MDQTMYKGNNNTSGQSPESLTDRWVQMNFSALNVPGCQTKWQYYGLPNSKHYRNNAQSCNETDHHSHWFCTECFTCINPYGNYVPEPRESTLCKCNAEEEQDDDYSEIFDLYSEQDKEDPYDGNIGVVYQEVIGTSGAWIEYEEELDRPNYQYETRSNTPSYLEDIDHEYDWRNESDEYNLQQDLHNIYLQNANFQQTISRQMEISSYTFTTISTSFRTNCIICNDDLTTTGIDHFCHVGYSLGQVHPEMDPSALVNEIWWTIPDAVQKENLQWQQKPPTKFRW